MLIPNSTVSFSFNFVQHHFLGLYFKTILAHLFINLKCFVFIF